MFYIIISIALLMIVIERCWPGTQLPTVKGWWQRIVLVNAAQLGIVLLAGQTWDRWMAGTSLLHLSEQWGDVAAGITAYLASTLVYYFWHRVRHESTFFWRFCHQLHHSVQRLEVVASFYKHPVEILINSLISSTLVYVVLGCSVRAAAIYTALAGVAEYFYHWNIRTPRWIGWIIQRPEAHRVHHQYQHHSQNYGDLPLWDWMFGTLKNPKESPARCGFDAGKEQRVREMLLFQDVNQTPERLPVTCFGCRKRWACASAKSTCSTAPKANSTTPSLS